MSSADTVIISKSVSSLTTSPTSSIQDSKVKIITPINESTNIESKKCDLFSKLIINLINLIYSRDGDSVSNNSQKNLTEKEVI